MSKPLILDTHIWFWLLIKHDRLNKPVLLEKINNANAESKLFISAITIWELGMLIQKDRIRIAGHPVQWVNMAIHTCGIQIIPLHPEISITSSFLNGKPPKDPADRIILSTAQFLDCTLMSADNQISTYCNTEGFDFINVK